MRIKKLFLCFRQAILQLKICRSCDCLNMCLMKYVYVNMYYINNEIFLNGKKKRIKYSPSQIELEIMSLKLVEIHGDLGREP